MATDVSVSVVIAWRDMGCPHRRAAADYVLGWYRWFTDHMGWEVIVDAGTDDATFTRASAINSAVRVARGQIIVQSDPDSLVPLERLRTAIVGARLRHGLVIPHSRYLYLDERATSAVLTESVDPFTWTTNDCDEYGADGRGNVVVFSRSTWEQVGGFDERFGLWGGDDAAFAYACEAMVEPIRRLEGDVIHLWHPRLPQSVPGNPGYADQFALLALYRDAAADSPNAVRALVNSR